MKSKKISVFLGLAVLLSCSPAVGFSQSQIAEFSNKSLTEVEPQLRKVKKKQKKKKRSPEKGVSKLTMNMQARKFIYNRKISILKAKTTVKVCNKNNFFYQPSAVRASEPTFDYGLVSPGKKNCKSNTFINSTGSIEAISFYDSSHPEMFAPFCILPDRQCIGGSLIEKPGVDGCELVETCCNDNLDNDGDGDVDCADEDCANNAPCNRKTFRGSVNYEIFSGTNSFDRPITVVVTYLIAPVRPLKVGSAEIACLRNPLNNLLATAIFSKDLCASSSVVRQINPSCPELLSRQLNIYRFENRAAIVVE